MDTSAPQRTTTKEAIANNLASRKTITTSLSSRELSIITLLAKGYTKAETGDKLHISVHTVDYHVRNIVRKLNARNVTAAVFIAMCEGLIQDFELS